MLLTCDLSEDDIKKAIVQMLKNRGYEVQSDVSLGKGEDGISGEAAQKTAVNIRYINETRWRECIVLADGTIRFDSATTSGPHPVVYEDPLPIEIRASLEYLRATPDIPARYDFAQYDADRKMVTFTLRR